MNPILGLDLSLLSTGWARVTERQPVLLEVSVGVIEGKGAGMGRIDGILEELQPLVRSACLVVIEGYSFGAKNKAHQVGELGGVVKHLLWQQGIEFVDIAPTVLKKFATGKGTAKKDQVRLGVYKRWGAEFETEHEIDAFVLAQIGRCILCEPSVPLNKEQQAALEKAKLSYYGREKRKEDPLRA